MALLCAAALLPVAVLAQTEVQPGVVVTTAPPGAQVTLIGEATVSGVAPVHFRQPLIGYYELKVEKAGWETHTRQLVLDPTRQISVDVELSRKTRLKAAVRSLFIPGWGQKYADRPTKATAFFLAAVGSGLAYLWADNDFDDKYETFRELEEEYYALPSTPEQEAFWPQVTAAQEDARDAEDVRRVTIGVAVGVWALNLIDVILFFPNEGETFSIKGVAVAPGVINGGVGVTLTRGF